MPSESMLGRYQVIRVLGRGSMGEVLEVCDVQTQDHYALKRIPPELSRSHAKLKELRNNFSLVSKLTHPHIVATRFLEVDPDNGDVYVIMDLVRGCDLGYWLVEERERLGSPDAPLPIATVLGIAEQIAAALDYAHSQPVGYSEDRKTRSFGILHRDLKPENIMLEAGRQYRPGIPFVKIVDFGIAAQVQSNVNSMTNYEGGINAVAGTPLYMAPEQWQGRRLSRAIDQWALAVIVYEMLEGRPPYTGISPKDLRERICNEPPSPAEALKPLQWEALRKALHQDRTQRYTSATAMIRALASADPATDKLVQIVEPMMPEDIGNVAGEGSGGLESGQQSSGKSTLAVSNSYDRVSNETAKDSHKNAATKVAPTRERKRKSNSYTPSSSSWTVFAFKVLFLTSATVMACVGLFLIFDKLNTEMSGGGDGAPSDPNSASGVPDAQTSMIQIQPVPPQSVAAGDLLQIQIEAFDKSEESSNLTYYLSSDSPSGAIMNESTGVISWQTHSTTPVGDYRFEVQVFSSRPAMDSVSTIFPVTVTKPETIGESQRTLSKSEQEAEQKSATDGVNSERPLSMRNDGAQSDLTILPKRITNSLGMDFILLEPGAFDMGSPQRENEMVHNVRLTQPCYLAVHEVTQEAFEKVMGNNPSDFKGLKNPVENVTWDEAVEFCRRVTRLSAERLEERVYRLPTEAEWEYACRAGSKTLYTFGNDEEELDTYAWHRDNSLKHTHPVGLKKPNALGFHDMHGNVWEWCGDFFGPYERHNVIDPTGPAVGAYRVARGGSCYSDYADCRSAKRESFEPSKQRYGSLGFRVGFTIARDKTN